MEEGPARQGAREGASRGEVCVCVCTSMHAHACAQVSLQVRMFSARIQRRPERRMSWFCFPFATPSSSLVQSSEAEALASGRTRACQARLGEEAPLHQGVWRPVCCHSQLTSEAARPWAVELLPAQLPSAPPWAPHLRPLPAPPLVWAEPGGAAEAQVPGAISKPHDGHFSQYLRGKKLLSPWGHRWGN